MKTNNEKFIAQEKRIIDSLNNQIKKIRERAEQDVLDCEKRIKEATENIEQAIRNEFSK